MRHTLFVIGIIIAVTTLDCGRKHVPVSKPGMAVWNSDTIGTAKIYEDSIWRNGRVTYGQLFPDKDTIPKSKFDGAVDSLIRRLERSEVPYSFTVGSGKVGVLYVYHDKDTLIIEPLDGPVDRLHWVRVGDKLFTGNIWSQANLQDNPVDLQKRLRAMYGRWRGDTTEINFVNDTILPISVGKSSGVIKGYITYDTVMVKMLCSYTQGMPTMVLNGYRVGNQFFDKDKKPQAVNIIMWMSVDWDWIKGRMIERSTIGYEDTNH